MTQPTDETQPHDIVRDPDPVAGGPSDAAVGPDAGPRAGAPADPGLIVPPPVAASAGAIPAPAPPPLAWDSSASSAVPEPAVADPAPPTITPPPPPASAMPPAATPPLRADPNRPAASDWREPAWFPPRDRPRARGGPNVAGVVVGLVILAIGLYYVLDVTLGLSLPRLSWGSLWPLILVVIGLLILARGAGRR